jgi:hypothetical protein
MRQQVPAIETLAMTQAVSFALSQTPAAFNALMDTNLIPKAFASPSAAISSKQRNSSATTAT